MMDHEHSDAATPAGTPRQMGMAVDEHETHARADANASHYIVPGDALAYGASLGNAHCWLTTRGNGSIQDIFSTDSARPSLAPSPCATAVRTTACCGPAPTG